MIVKLALLTELFNRWQTDGVFSRVGESGKHELKKSFVNNNHYKPIWKIEKFSATLNCRSKANGDIWTILHLIMLLGISISAGLPVIYHFTVRRNRRRFFRWPLLKYSVLCTYIHRLYHIWQSSCSILFSWYVFIFGISIRIRSQSKSVTHTSTLQWDCLSGLILLLSHSPCGFIPADNLN